MVPEGWEFPTNNLKDMWNLWHFGHIGDKIRPLRFLKLEDLIGGSGKERALWTKTGGVMREISKMMVGLKLVPSIKDVRGLNLETSLAHFDIAVIKWMEHIEENSTQERSRWTELKMSTLYKKSCERKQRADPERTAAKKRQRKPKRKRGEIELSDETVISDESKSDT